MEFRLKDKKALIEIIAFAILLYWVLNHFDLIKGAFILIMGILTPFILGSSIAFVLNVPMKLLEKQLGKVMKNRVNIRRGISMLFAFAVAIGIILFVLLMLIPELIRTIAMVNEGIPTFINGLSEWMTNLLDTYPEIPTYIASVKFEWSSISKTVINILQNSMTNVLSSTLGFASSMFSVVVNLIIGIIFAIYILIQKEKLSIQGRKLIYAYLPEKISDQIVDIMSLTNKTFTSFIAGQCTEAVIFGTLCFIGMNIFRFPYALTISVLVGFTALIPVFGAFIGTALGALLILVANPISAVWFVVFICVLQQLEGNLIYPRVVGTSVGLPGMWVMLAVTAGGSLMGLLGMLVFVPLSSVLYCLLRQSVYKRIQTRKILPAKLE